MISEDIKSNIRVFVQEELFSLWNQWIFKNCSWEEKLPKLNELRKKSKTLGLWPATDS